MRQLRNILAVFISILALIGSGYAYFTQPKIAYVKSQDLVYGYVGMQEAHEKLKAKKISWEANVDTLENRFRRAITNYQTNTLNYSAEQKIQVENRLRQQEQQLMAYKQTIADKTKEEDEKLTKGVLNQINSFVEAYGEKNGYDLIIGTTNSGNLLYGKITYDKTNEILEQLNKNYQSGE